MVTLEDMELLQAGESNRHDPAQPKLLMRSLKGPNEDAVFTDPKTRRVFPSSCQFAIIESDEEYQRLGLTCWIVENDGSDHRLILVNAVSPSHHHSYLEILSSWVDMYGVWQVGLFPVKESNQKNAPRHPIVGDLATEGLNLNTWILSDFYWFSLRTHLASFMKYKALNTEHISQWPRFLEGIKNYRDDPVVKSILRGPREVLTMRTGPSIGSYSLSAGGLTIRDVRAI